MRYVDAQIEEYNREYAYRIFVTKQLQLIPQNKWVTKDYNDLIVSQNVDHRSGEQIVFDLIKNAGLRFKE